MTDRKTAVALLVIAVLFAVFYSVGYALPPNTFPPCKPPLVSIGMSRDELLSKCGQPSVINYSLYEFGLHEQWVYRPNYVYVENDKVNSLQYSYSP